MCHVTFQTLILLMNTIVTKAKIQKNQNVAISSIYTQRVTYYVCQFLRRLIGLCRYHVLRFTLITFINLIPIKYRLVNHELLLIRLIHLIILVKLALVVSGIPIKQYRDLDVFERYILKNTTASYLEWQRLSIIESQMYLSDTY